MVGREGRGGLEQRQVEHVAWVDEACVPCMKKNPPELPPGHLVQSAEKAPGPSASRGD